MWWGVLVDAPWARQLRTGKSACATEKSQSVRD
jgi:hypothetical protein